MEPVSTTGIIVSSLNIIDKLLDQIPDYDDRLKQKYRYLKDRFIIEKQREDRIDNHLEHYRESLETFLEAFSSDLKENGNDK